MISWYEILLRLGAALLFCGAIGLQRFLVGKEAGVRTHILVGVGAAVFTLVSAYAFNTPASGANRIAAQVVSGIGFIGGGAILKEGASIKGLTTAAGLWAAAALGMAAGAGLFVIGGLGTAVMLLTLIVLRRAETHLPRRMANAWTLDVTLSDDRLMPQIKRILDETCRNATLESLESARETHLIYVAELPGTFDLATMTERLRAAGAHTVTWRSVTAGTGERGA
jgi:putative Mg2+ transporter-C (MgtC) family protein